MPDFCPHPRSYIRYVYQPPLFCICFLMPTCVDAMYWQVWHCSIYVASNTRLRSLLYVVISHASSVHIVVICALGLDRYWYRVSADTCQYRSVLDTSSPVVRLPVSSVNTVATHAYSLSLYRIFAHIPAYIYNLRTPIPHTKSHFQYKKFVQPGISIGIGIAAANSIRYRVPARYRSNSVEHIILVYLSLSHLHVV